MLAAAREGRFESARESALQAREYRGPLAGSPHVSRILVPGETCWRIERAGRVSVIIDAADYFLAVKAAMLKARHSVMLVGWDLDTRINFENGAPTLAGPNQLGPFLKWLVKHQPGLHVRVLKWDLGMLQALGRGMMPVVLVNLATSRRLHFRLDGRHPVGGAHHQKVVVIDDNTAFCGGIDMTVGRWDTREHQDRDPDRLDPHGKLLGPWHDVTTAVDGAAARALGDMARERWWTATGERLAVAAGSGDAWPDGLEPTLNDVDVAVARTLPELDDRAEVREIEALYLAGIRCACRTLYLESQYLASRRLAEAMAERLQDPDGPEIIIVLPRRIDDGWLEHEAMDSARTRLLHMLWRADHRHRLGAYFPVTQAGEPIYVHAKVMVVDDMLLRIGSSNLNNRSMGFDSECDLAIEAGIGDEDLRARIIAVRQDLVAEHLGITTDALDARQAEVGGSLLAVIEKLRGSGRTLKPFEQVSMTDGDTPLAENELLDPEQAASGFGTRLRRGLAKFCKA